MSKESPPSHFLFLRILPTHVQLPDSSAIEAMHSIQKIRNSKQKGKYWFPFEKVEGKFFHLFR